MDFARARDAMVDSQIRPADVTDLGITRAMRSLQRELFAAEPLQGLAYSDMELPAGGGRTLLRPRDLAKLLQALAPKAGENAMEIAGASGYGAAILAQIGLSVTMLEPDPDLCRAARAALEASGIGASVTVVSTDVRQGWSEAAPYDVIMLNGAAEEVPSVWLDQLAEGGRMGVIVREGPAGSARLYTKANGVVSYRIAFDAAPPVAPGVSSPKVFSF